MEKYYDAIFMGKFLPIACDIMILKEKEERFVGGDLDACSRWEQQENVEYADSGDIEGLYGRQASLDATGNH